MYILETLEDKLKYELGARDFELMVLKHKLEDAEKKIKDLESITEQKVKKPK